MDPDRKTTPTTTAKSSTKIDRNNYDVNSADGDKDNDGGAYT